MIFNIEKPNSNKHRVVALDDSGKQMGFLNISFNVDKRGPWITGLYVDPTFRRKNVAKGLVTTAKNNYGKPLFIKPSPYESEANYKDDPDMSEADLMNMYKTFGFKDIGKGALVYEKNKVRTFEDYTKGAPILYNASAVAFGTKKFNPKEYNLPSKVTEIIGRGAESLVVGSKNPNDPVFKINLYDFKNEHSNVPRTEAGELKDRKQLIDAIGEIERMGSINIPDVVMYYGAYMRAKERGEKVNLPKNAYYDKESKCFVIDKHISIEKTNTELLPGGIIKQNRIKGQPIDQQLFQKIASQLKSKGFYVDMFGGRRNVIMTDDNKLAFIDGVTKL